MDVGDGDPDRRDEAQGSFPLDPELHPQNIRGRSLDPGLVGIDVDQEEQCDDAYRSQGGQKTKNDEEPLHRVRILTAPGFLDYP